MGHTNLNRWEGIGRIARDPELSYTQNQTALCKFAIACGRKFKNANGDQVEHVDFFDIVAWGNLATIISQYQHKGDLIYIEGRLSQEKWVDKDTQKNRSKIAITATGCEFLGGKSGGSAPGPAPAPGQPAGAPAGGSAPDMGGGPPAPSSDPFPGFDEESLGDDEVPF